jgi:O-antigen/teichoic acid export membrane protein
MQKSFTENYIKIYFWQSISLVLGFASLLIVIRYLSSNQSVYGIYSICLSVTIFLSYADLDFLGAGQKYAAEAYSRKEDEHELEYLAFSSFILLIFVLIIAGIFVFLGFNPVFLIKGQF